MRRIAGIFLINLSLLLAGCGTSSQMQKTNSKTEINREVHGLYLDAAKEMVLNNHEKAKTLLNEVLDKDSLHAPSHYQLARIAKQNSEWKNAAKHIRKAVAGEPGNKWYKMEFAEILKNQRNFDEAVSVYEDVLKEFPNRPELFIDIAQLYMIQEDYKNAIRYLDELEKLVGINKRLVMQKQKLYMQMDDVQGAIGEVKKLINNDPENIEYRNILANLYVRTDQFDDARKVYEKVKQIDPSNAYVHINLADLYKKQDKKDSAFRELKKGFKNPSLDLQTKVKILTTYYSITEMYSDQKAQAFALAEILVETHPKESNAHAIYADFLFKDQRLDEAEEQFKKAIELNTSKFYNWESYLNILLQQSKYQKLKEESTAAQDLFPMQPTPYLFAGLADLQLDNFESAEKHLTSGKKLIADNEQIEIQFNTYLGEVYNEMKQYEKSDKFFNKAIEQDPENSFTLNNYSYYLSLRGDKLDLAEKYAKKAVRIDPDNANNQDTYGWVLFKMERYEEAKFWIEKAIKTSDDPSGTIMEHMGDVYFELGDPEKAVEYWKKAKKTGDTTEQIDDKIEQRKRVIE